MQIAPFFWGNLHVVFFVLLVSERVFACFSMPILGFCWIVDKCAKEQVFRNCLIFLAFCKNTEKYEAFKCHCYY